MASCLRRKRFSAASARRDRETSTRRRTRSHATEDNVLRLCVRGWKTAPSMNDQLYTLLDVTRLPIGGWARFLRTTAHESDLRNRCRRDEYDDCRADTGDACAHWGHRPRWHPRHIESRAPRGQWRMDAGGTAHALIRPDLGDVAIPLAHAKGQAHPRGALLRGGWHAADRRGSSAGPGWRHRTRHALGHALNGQDNGCKHLSPSGVASGLLLPAAIAIPSRPSGHGTAGSRPCIGLPLRTSMPDGNT